MQWLIRIKNSWWDKGKQPMFQYVNEGMSDALDTQEK